MHLGTFALFVQMYCRCVFSLTSFLKRRQRNRAMKGRCISKTTLICTERSSKGKEMERLRQETHTCVSLTQTHTHWHVAVVAAVAHVSMLWLQSVASFAEDHSRIKGTAFLDRAASLCPFLAVPLVCRACLDSGSVCLTVLQCWQTEQVVHFVGAATFICFSCPLSYFLSYLILSCLYFSINFWKIFLVLCSCFTPSLTYSPI